ncbi:hypothetical protein C8R46DRAFT_1283531 [Mycena filopes]|nr:hypothetical protein C8R46DRAFT_1283531 [Mycena filopes]
MSSRASTPVDSDDELNKAMTQETPTTVRTSGEKRAHTTMTRDHDGSGDEDGLGNSLPLTLALSNQNAVAAVRHYSKRLRLHADQGVELETTLKDPAPVREAKLMGNIFALRNELKQIVSSQPTFMVSSELKTNIAKYAPAILLSEKLSSYKGDGPKTLLLEVIKRLRFDIPVGLERNPSDWGKVIHQAEYSLTQRRSKTKKAIRASLKPTKDADTNAISYAPSSEHQNIFDLATAVVKGTSCSVNIILCSRVALMRKVYLKHPNDNFWDELDKALQGIRTKAAGDSKQIVRAFRHVLDKDQGTHGKKTYKDTDIEDGVDEFQKTVDDIIDIGVVDAATSAQDQPDQV